MMRRELAILGSALFLLIAPGIGAGLVPFWISRWDVQAPLFGFPPIRALGVLLIVAGIPVLLDSFARFALQGTGTPAPVFPTLHLVVKGFYRYVRNPIYLSVVAVIFLLGLDFLDLKPSATRVFLLFGITLVFILYLGTEMPVLVLTALAERLT